MFEILREIWFTSSLKTVFFRVVGKRLLSNFISSFNISFFTKLAISSIDFEPSSILSICEFMLSIFSESIQSLDTTSKISLSISNKDIYISQLKQISFPNEVTNNAQAISMLSELRSNFGAEIIKDKNISTNDNLIQALVSQY